MSYDEPSYIYHSPDYTEYLGQQDTFCHECNQVVKLKDSVLWGLLLICPKCYQKKQEDNHE